jgi:hypothetical protein
MFSFFKGKNGSTSQATPAAPSQNSTLSTGETVPSVKRKSTKPVTGSELYMQLFNAEGDTVFIGLLSGKVFWKLPNSVTFDEVKYFAHISDDDGRIYFEEMKTEAVTWSLSPADSDISLTARKIIAQLDNMSREETGKMIGQPFDDDVTNYVNDAVDRYFEERDQKKQQQQFAPEPSERNFPPKESKPVHDEYYVQTFNNEGDPVFIGLKSGVGYWTLPQPSLFGRVKIFGHINDEDGRLYFEDIDNDGKVTWALEIDNVVIFEAGLQSVQQLDNLNRMETEDFVQEAYDEEAIQGHNEQLDAFLEEKEEKKKIQETISKQPPVPVATKEPEKVGKPSTVAAPVVKKPTEEDEEEEEENESDEGEFIERPLTFIKENYIQTFNADGDTVIVGLTSSSSYWTLINAKNKNDSSSDLLEKIVLFSHVNESDGKLYFENGFTGEVTWSLPDTINSEINLTKSAKAVIGKVDQLNRSETEILVGQRYNEEETMKFNEEIDHYLEMRDNERKLQELGDLPTLEENDEEDDREKEEKEQEVVSFVPKFENKLQSAPLQPPRPPVTVPAPPPSQSLPLTSVVPPPPAPPVPALSSRPLPPQPKQEMAIPPPPQPLPKQSKEYFMQAFNVEGDTVIIGLLSGHIYWTLPNPSTPLEDILYLTHLSDDGRIYFEDISSGEIIWSPPPVKEGFLSSEAHRMIVIIEPMTRAETEQHIGVPFNQEKTNVFNEKLEKFLLQLDEKKKAKDGEDSSAMLNRRTSFNHFNGEMSSALKTLQESFAPPAAAGGAAKLGRGSVFEDPLVTRSIGSNVLKPIIFQSGYLKKQATQSARNWKKRFIVLTTFTIAYYETEKQFHSNSSKSKGEIPITSDMECVIFTTPGEGFGFKVFNKQASQIIFAAISDEERKKWIASIKNIILKNKSFLKSLNYSLVNKLPNCTPEKLFKMSIKVIKSYEVKKFFLLSRDLLYCFKEEMISVEWELKLSSHVLFYVIFQKDPTASTATETNNFFYFVDSFNDNASYILSFHGSIYEFNVWKDAIHKYTQNIHVFDETQANIMQEDANQTESQGKERKSLARISKAMDSLFGFGGGGNKAEENKKLPTLLTNESINNENTPSRRKTRQSSLIRASIRQSLTTTTNLINPFLVEDDDGDAEPAPQLKNPNNIGRPSVASGDALAVAAARKKEKQKSLKQLSPTKSILITKRDSSTNWFDWNDENKKDGEGILPTSDSMKNNVSDGIITETTVSSINVDDMENNENHPERRKTRRESFLNNGRKSMKIVAEQEATSAIGDLFGTIGSSSQSNPISSPPPPPPPPHRLSLKNNKNNNNKPLEAVASPPPPPPPPSALISAKIKPPTVVENNNNSNEKFEKFEKLKQLLPEGAVRQKMQLEGFTTEEMDSFFASNNGKRSEAPSLKQPSTLPEAQEKTKSGETSVLPPPPPRLSITNKAKPTAPLPVISSPPPPPPPAPPAGPPKALSIAEMKRKAQEKVAAEKEQQERQQNAGSGDGDSISSAGKNALEMAALRKKSKKFSTTSSVSSFSSADNSVPMTTSVNPSATKTLFGGFYGGTPDDENYNNDFLSSPQFNPRRASIDRRRSSVKPMPPIEQEISSSENKSDSSSQPPVKHEEVAKPVFDLSLDDFSNESGPKLNALEAARLRKKLKESGIDQKVVSRPSQVIPTSSSTSAVAQDSTIHDSKISELLTGYHSSHKSSLLALEEFLEKKDSDDEEKAGKERKEKEKQQPELAKKPSHSTMPVTQNTLNAIRKSTELKEKRRQSSNRSSPEVTAAVLEKKKKEEEIEEKQANNKFEMPSTITGIFGMVDVSSDEDDEEENKPHKNEQPQASPLLPLPLSPPPPSVEKMKSSAPSPITITTTTGIRDAAMKRLSQRPSVTSRQSPPPQQKEQQSQPKVITEEELTKTVEVPPKSSAVFNLFGGNGFMSQVSDDDDEEEVETHKEEMTKTVENPPKSSAVSSLFGGNGFMSQVSDDDDEEEAKEEKVKKPIPPVVKKPSVSFAEDLIIEEKQDYKDDEPPRRKGANHQQEEEEGEEEEEEEEAMGRFSHSSDFSTLLNTNYQYQDDFEDADSKKKKKGTFEEQEEERPQPQEAAAIIEKINYQNTHLAEATAEKSTVASASSEGGYVNAIDLFKIHKNKPLVKIVFENYSYQKSIDVTSFQQFSYDFGFYMSFEDIVTTIKEYSTNYQKHQHLKSVNDDYLKLSYEDFLIFWRTHPVFR